MPKQKRIFKRKPKVPKFHDEPKKRKKRDTSIEERALVKRVLERLDKDHEFIHWTDEDTPLRVIKGEFDFFLVTATKFCVIEAKVENKPLSPEQLTFAHRCHAVGVRHVVLRFRDIQSPDDFWCDFETGGRHISRLTLRDFGL